MFNLYIMWLSNYARVSLQVEMSMEFGVARACN